MDKGEKKCSDEEYVDVEDEEEEEEEEEKKAFKKFKDRNGEWDDITPLPQFEEKTPIAPIDYSPQYVEVMNYFRAILHKDELSKRAYKLTAEVILLNPGNYTAWYFRRKCIDHLQINFEEEMKFLTKIGIHMTKIYQYWHHRRVISQAFNKMYEDEMEFLEDIMTDDDKNYHMYTYRMWLCEHFKLWEQEIAFMDQQIKKTPKNNSLWSYRYFLLVNTKEFDNEFIVEQIDYCTTVIKSDKNNESAWVFLKGLFKFDENENFENSSLKKVPIQNYPQLKFFCEEIAAEIENRFALAFLIDIHTATPHSLSGTQIAMQLCDLEAFEVDKIRKNYWLWRKDEISRINKRIREESLLKD